MAKSRILDYILVTLALPVMVWVELNELSEDISLALTGGKYSGYGRLNRKRYRGGDESDGESNDGEPDPDWLRPPDYGDENFHQAIWRAKRLKYLEKRVDDSGIPELVLTATGQEKVLQRFPLLKSAGKQWQGWWLVVPFDIPEINRQTRNAVRRQLTAIGFGQWQKSVYVCPHDVTDILSKMLKDNQLEDKVVPMISKRILAGSDWEFARRIFKIDKIKAEYQQISEALAPPTAPEPKHRDHLRRQFGRYIEIVKSDPLLPPGLAPQEGYGRELAQAALQKYAAALNSAGLV